MKRFTEANKWRDPWFLDLTVDAKLAFWYITENCDNAGVWEPNYRLANFCLRRDIDWDSVRKEFGDRMALLQNGNWWMTKFIPFQYGKLTETCAPHRFIISLVEKHGLVLSKGTVTVPEGLAVPTATDKEKEKEKEKEGLGGVGGKDSTVFSLKAEEPPKSAVDHIAKASHPTSRRIIPTLEEWIAHGKKIEPLWPESDARHAFDHYEANGWVQGAGKPIKKWEAAARTCIQNWRDRGGRPFGAPSEPKPQPIRVNY